MQMDEITFWQHHADSGSLLEAIRLDKNRAIYFFGALAVFAEDERSFFCTLEAYTILSKNDEDLLRDLNHIPSQMISGLKGLSPETTNLVADRVLFTPEDAAALKRTVRKYLEQVVGRREQIDGQ